MARQFFELGTRATVPATLFIAAAAILVPTGASAKYAAFVIDADTGKTLYAVNPDTKNYPASLTKMMTLYMTFEALDNKKFGMNSALKVSRTAAGRSPSKLGLRAGSRILVRHAIPALVVKSANDVATVLAEAMGKTERNFAKMMTKRARRLGMTNTTFRNASGLPNRGQLSTARDMAKLAQALMRDFPHYYHLFNLKTFRYGKRVYTNHNKLIGKVDGVDGLKTGYIRASGFNLAASASRNGRRLIAVVFGGRSSKWRNRHVTNLIERGFKRMPVLVAKKTSPLSRPSSPMDRTSRPRIAQEGDWAIQVGAFRRYTSAHRAVTEAARSVPSLLRKPYSIRRLTGRNGNVFRARLVGLTEDHARASCDRLKVRKKICVVVQERPNTAQGSR